MAFCQCSVFGEFLVTLGIENCAITVTGKWQLWEMFNVPGC